MILNGKVPGKASETFDVKSLYPDNYTEFDSSNFKFIVTSITAFGDNDNSKEGTATCNPNCTYDASTGILTVSGLGGSNGSGDDVSVLVRSGYVLMYY